MINLLFKEIKNKYASTHVETHYWHWLYLWVIFEIMLRGLIIALSLALRRFFKHELGAAFPYLRQHFIFIVLLYWWNLYIAIRFLKVNEMDWAFISCHIPKAFCFLMITTQNWVSPQYRFIFVRFLGFHNLLLLPLDIGKHDEALSLVSLLRELIPIKVYLL